jgi:FkbM family methyltransferase
MIKYLIRLPFFKRLIPSLTLKILSKIKKNRRFFKIGNFLMFLDFRDPVDRQIILYQNYEHDSVLVFFDFIKKKSASCFLDIGANSGYYSFFFSYYFQNLKVEAFEPNYEAQFKFRQTLQKEKKKFSNIKLHSFGLSDKNAVLKMSSLLKRGYPQTGGSSVENINFDMTQYKIFDAEFRIGDEILKMNNKNLAIKIDVEGHEFKVLMGLKQIINNNKCLIMVESKTKNFNKVNDFLTENNYKLIFKMKNRNDYFYRNFNE